MVIGHLGFHLSLVKAVDPWRPPPFFSSVIFLEWEKNYRPIIYIIIIEWHLCHHSPHISFWLPLLFQFEYFAFSTVLPYIQFMDPFWGLRVSGLLPSDIWVFASGKPTIPQVPAPYSYIDYLVSMFYPSYFKSWISTFVVRFVLEINFSGV